MSIHFNPISSSVVLWQQGLQNKKKFLTMSFGFQ